MLSLALVAALAAATPAAAVAEYQHRDAPAPGPTAIGRPEYHASADPLEPYRGLGTWVDVYDWSNFASNGNPSFGVDDVDRIADAGIKTLYLQASKHDAPRDVLESDRLNRLIDRAHGNGIAVVAWYVPTFVDIDRDLERVRAIAALDVEGIAIDIEARDVADTRERNRRLIEFSERLSAQLPDRLIGAVVMPPVQLEVVNPAFWPAFPYRDLVGAYGVWMTMGYWTDRTAASGYREPYRYTTENLRRLRANLGRDLPIHAIGGIGDNTSVEHAKAYARAVREGRSIGASIYDWETTRPEVLRALRESLS